MKVYLKDNLASDFWISDLWFLGQTAMQMVQLGESPTQKGLAVDREKYLGNVLGCFLRCVKWFWSRFHCSSGNKTVKCAKKTSSFSIFSLIFVLFYL